MVSVLDPHSPRDGRRGFESSPLPHQIFSVTALSPQHRHQHNFPLPTVHPVLIVRSSYVFSFLFFPSACYIFSLFHTRTTTVLSPFVISIFLSIASAPPLVMYCPSLPLTLTQTHFQFQHVLAFFHLHFNYSISLMPPLPRSHSPLTHGALTSARLSRPPPQHPIIFTSLVFVILPTPFSHLFFICLCLRLALTPLLPTPSTQLHTTFPCSLIFTPFVFVLLHTPFSHLLFIPTCLKPCSNNTSPTLHAVPTPPPPHPFIHLHPRFSSLPSPLREPNTLSLPFISLCLRLVPAHLPYTYIPLYSLAPCTLFFP